MKKLFTIMLIAVGVFYIGVVSPEKPSNERDWTLDQKVLPILTTDGDILTVQNVRNFTYTSTTNYAPNYYTKEYDLSKIKRVWYIVEPFSGFKGAAHTFLSFEFDNDVFLAVSVEIRKEVGEEFSVWKGLLRNYELSYVFADEKDVIQLRSNHRKDLVYVYPVQTTPEKVRALLENIIPRAQHLALNPEFYNTLTNNCTTNIIDHINTITPHRIPFTYAAVFPEYSDKVAHKLGLIPHDALIEDIRIRYLINEKAELYANSPNFSIRIREGF